MGRRQSQRNPLAQQRRCEAIKKNGEPCKGYAIVETYDWEGGPRCRVHSKTPEEISAITSRMAQKRNLIRRSNVEAKPRSELSPGVTFGEVMAVLAPALVAEDHFTGQPLWNVRIAAAGTLLAAFPRHYRETPEKVNEMLRSLLPEHVYDSERHQAQKAYEALRAEWDSIQGKRWSDLHGLFVKPYGGHMIAPWEDAAKIQRSRPAPVSPDRAPVIRLPNGGVALERADALPLELQLEEPDDLTVDVDLDVVLPY